MDNDFATGYMCGADNKGCDNSMLGGGWWWIIIIVLLCGWGGNGWGGNGQQPWVSGAMTRSDISEGFALNGIERGIQGIQQGICDATYALNNTMRDGFAGTQRELCEMRAGLGEQITANRFAMQQEACKTQRIMERGFADLSYQGAQDTCTIKQAIHEVGRDMIEAGNANYRRLYDYMVGTQLDDLRAENQQLRLAASQSGQNAYMAALSEAQTAELIRRLQPPQPVPAFPVNPPYPYGGGRCGQCGQCGQWQQ